MRKLLLGLIGLLFAVPAVATDLPAGYTELEYIESTGTQYIDTGLYGTLNTEAEIDVHLNETSDATGNRIFGNYTNTEKAITINASHTNGSAQRFGDKSTSTEVYSSERSVYKTNKTNLTRNGVVLVTFDATTPFTTEGTLLLGTTGTSTVGVIGKIYSAIVRENGTVVRNFVPAKNSSNVIGMYDTVNNRFFTNAGTGEFIAGPVVPEQQIKIATTAYNSARFSPVVTELNDTIATIRSVVTNTINQTKAIADLQATKQTRPDENCPAGKKCLLVEDDAGTPHWYEIIENAYGLPNGYTALEYIESTGTQEIDTGVKGNLNTKIEMDFALMRTSNTNIGIYGSGATTQNQSAFCMVTNSTGTYVFPQFDSVSRTTTEAGNLNFVLGQRYHIVHSKDGWYYDNQLGATWATPQSFTTPSNLKLFATDGCSSSGTSAANSYARIYYTKIWDGNTLVRDLVPARRNSDDMLGMYDTVNGQFYTNQGTGTFDAGPEI